MNWRVDQLKSSEAEILNKLDMEKAFDCVSWNFLLHLLGRCGFEKKNGNYGSNIVFQRRDFLSW